MILPSSINIVKIILRFIKIDSRRDSVNSWKAKGTIEITLGNISSY